MRENKKLFFLGLLIFSSLLFFSFSGQAQAQVCPGSCEIVCPSGCEISPSPGSSPWADCAGTETCCDMTCASGSGPGTGTGTGTGSGSGTGTGTGGAIIGSGASCGLGSGQCGTNCASTIWYGVCSASGESCCGSVSPGAGSGSGSGSGTSAPGTYAPITGGALSLVDPVALGVPAPEYGIAQVLFNFLLWLVFIFGLLAMAAFIISGIIYLTSAGDENRAAAAKRNMTYSVIGVIVGLSGYVIILAIQSALSASSPLF